MAQRYTVTVRPVHPGSRAYLWAFHPDVMENIYVRVHAQDEGEARKKAAKALRAEIVRGENLPPAYFILVRPSYVRGETCVLGNVVVNVTPGW